MAASKDYYKILGVPKSATEKEIKSAYRKLARKHHPDVNPGDKASEEQFKLVSEAYEVLKDPENRKAYDRFGPQWEQWQQAQKAGATATDFEAYGPGGGGFHFDGNFDDVGFGSGAGGPDIGSIFEGLFGGATRGRGGRFHVDQGGFGGFGANFAPQPQSVQAEVQVSLEEAYSGSERQISVGGRRLTVKIPRGVNTGSKIRLAGEAPGANGQKADVILNVVVKPHVRFKRDGDNLTEDVQVPYLLAALGGEIAVPTMTGRVTMKVPAGVQSGQTLRLQGKGMPKLKGEGSGDLMARVMITVPKPLSAREQEVLTELAIAQGLKAG
ncbi:MAG: J domain-containing protein [Armatimonadetes bacterium]|nr:J domain-containing protein [Armatimonadota bacterium]